jgi:hypothetical protein
MSKKRFHCQAAIHVGNKCISITDEGHAFLLSIEDANGKFSYLKEAIATGKYPIAMDLVNSCPKMMVGATIKYQLQQHDAEKLFHSLDKALHH